MGKAQSEILGTIVLTGILLVIVAVTFLWGTPIIQKNIDKGSMNLIIQKIGEINSAITYTASTGSNSVVELDLRTSSLLVDTENNRLIIEATSSVPIIASIDEMPINYYELATTRENVAHDTTNLISTDPSITGYNLDTHHANTTISSTFYNVSVYENTTSSNWELVCIWTSTLTENSDCAYIGETIVKEGNEYELVSILSSGTAAYFNGATIENAGVLGSEPSGIISAKSLRVGDKEKITFYLTYRKMIAPTADEYKLLIDCTMGCSASGSTKTLVISRTNTVREANATTTYINIGVQ
jgi:hypothetical protein